MEITREYPPIIIKLQTRDEMEALTQALAVARQVEKNGIDLNRMPIIEHLHNTLCHLHPLSEPYDRHMKVRLYNLI